MENQAELVARQRVYPVSTHEWFMLNREFDCMSAMVQNHAIYVEEMTMRLEELECKERDRHARRRENEHRLARRGSDCKLPTMDATHHDFKYSFPVTYFISSRVVFGQNDTCEISKVMMVFLEYIKANVKNYQLANADMLECCLRTQLTNKGCKIVESEGDAIISGCRLCRNF